MFITKDMLKEARENNKIPILYNTCFGEFGISEKAYKLYNERYPKTKGRDSMHKLRTNKVMADIFIELQSGINARNSTLDMIFIDKKYKNFYEVLDPTEKGAELVVINFQDYKLAAIGNITRNGDLSSDQKIFEIEKILNETNEQPFKINMKFQEK